MCISEQLDAELLALSGGDFGKDNHGGGAGAAPPCPNGKAEGTTMTIRRDGVALRADVENMMNILKKKVVMGDEPLAANKDSVFAELDVRPALGPKNNFSDARDQWDDGGAPSGSRHHDDSGTVSCPSAC